LAGKLEEAGRKWWVAAGLGARGLVYHAWLGNLLARAVLADDEGLLPAELRRWKPEPPCARLAAAQ
jgi:glycine/D-amino acid oxidase-like deaminating enzyme